MARSRLYGSRCLQLLTRSIRSTCALWQKRTAIENEIMHSFAPLRPQQFILIEQMFVTSLLFFSLFQAKSPKPYNFHADSCWNLTNFCGNFTVFFFLLRSSRKFFQRPKIWRKSLHCSIQLAKIIQCSLCVALSISFSKLQFFTFSFDFHHADASAHGSDGSRAYNECKKTTTTQGLFCLWW